eukprot:TRINITY_DN47373_c0_g1_i1.p1 TRINITY_DN47373_c0_g1~~TRINITY_DN47373_c0_g1_i1.p1  ORF type:complete len:440 (+),score=91.28 TRINITY_DN47373_c0_g1_i1:67-1386(+)
MTRQRRYAATAAVMLLQAARPLAQDVLNGGYPIRQLSGTNFRVHVFEPNSTQGLYRGSRYDWSSMLTMDVLGRDKWGSLRWPKRVFNTQGSGAEMTAGFVEEFGCGAAGAVCDATSGAVNGVLGWENGQTTFLKIGAGAYTKAASTTYDSSASYTLSQAPTVDSVTSTDTSVTITMSDTLTSSSNSSRVWAYQLRKTITMMSGQGLSESVIATGLVTVTYELTNNGTDPFRTAHVGLNPLSVGGYAVKTMGTVNQSVAVGTPVGPETSIRVGSADATCDLGALCTYLTKASPGWFSPETALVYGTVAGNATLSGTIKRSDTALGWTYYYNSLMDKSVTSVTRAVTGTGVTLLSEVLYTDTQAVCPAQAVLLPEVAPGETARWATTTLVVMQFKPKDDGDLSISTLVVCIALIVVSASGIGAGHFFGKQAHKAPASPASA